MSSQHEEDVEEQNVQEVDVREMDVEERDVQEEDVEGRYLEERNIVETYFEETYVEEDDVEERYAEEDDIEEGDVEERHVEEGDVEEGDGEEEDFEEVDNISEEVGPTSDIDTDDDLMNVPSQSGFFIGNEDQEGNLRDFRCVVCEAVPFKSIFQCENHHLMCPGCYQIRVLDKMLQSELGTCPICAVRIHRHGPSRATEAEQALANIDVSCEKCGLELTRGDLEFHVRNDCPNKLAACKYKRIGCRWKGFVGVAVAEHEENCELRDKKGSDLMEALSEIQDQIDARQTVLEKVMKLMQLANITVRLLHLKPEIHTFPCNRFETCCLFEAFNKKWSILLNWQVSQVDPEEPDQDEDESSISSLLFQLCLISPVDSNRRVTLTYTLVSGTHSDVRFKPNICDKFGFNSDHQIGPPALLYENTKKNLKTLIFERGFFGRLFMARI